MSILPFTIIRNARPLKSSKPQLSSAYSNPLLLTSYNRKEKSLEELSRKFLQMFLSSSETLISLDRITDSLGVERRRIYDIINILESLNLVTRKGKNNYRWNGFDRVYETIRGFEKVELKEMKKNSFHNFQIKREKSLKLLSIGFLGLFLKWKGTMTLEEAAKNLSENLSENVMDHKIKTKIRRLYDIANVFKSLGLIRKTLLENKKPAFYWLGIAGLDDFVQSNRKDLKRELNENLNQDFFMQCLKNLLEAKNKPAKCYVTPIIKRTLTIIYPRSEDTQTSNSNSNSLEMSIRNEEADRKLLKPLFSNEKESFFLKDRTNFVSELKRMPLINLPQGLDISKKSSFKKIKREINVVDKENIKPF